MTRAAEQELRSRVRSRLRSSTLRGAGRLLDLGGTFRDSDTSPAQENRQGRSDTEAIAHAWQRVGTYLNRAMHQLEAERSKHE